MGFGAPREWTPNVTQANRIIDGFGVGTVNEEMPVAYYEEFVTVEKTKELMDVWKKSQRSTYFEYEKFCNPERVKELVDKKIANMKKQDSTASLTEPLRRFFKEVVFPTLVVSDETLVFKMDENENNNDDETLALVSIPRRVTPQMLVARIQAEPSKYDLRWLVNLANSEEGKRKLTTTVTARPATAGGGGADIDPTATLSNSTTERTTIAKVTGRHIKEGFLHRVAADLCPPSTGPKKLRGPSKLNVARNKLAEEARKKDEKRVSDTVQDLNKEILRPMEALTKKMNDGGLSNEEMEQCHEYVKRCDAIVEGRESTHCADASTHKPMHDTLSMMADLSESLQALCEWTYWAKARVASGQVRPRVPDFGVDAAAAAIAVDDPDASKDTKKRGRKKGNDIESLTHPTQLRRSILEGRRTIKNMMFLDVAKANKYHNTLLKEVRMCAKANSGEKVLERDDFDENDDDDMGLGGGGDYKEEGREAVDGHDQERITRLKQDMENLQGQMMQKMREMVDLTERPRDRRGAVNCLVVLQAGTNAAEVTEMITGDDHHGGPRMGLGVRYNIDLCLKLLSAAAPLTDEQTSIHEKETNGGLKLLNRVKKARTE
jgi:hypothetical protein